LIAEAGAGADLVGDFGEDGLALDVDPCGDLTGGCVGHDGIGGGKDGVLGEGLVVDGRTGISADDGLGVEHGSGGEATVGDPLKLDVQALAGGECAQGAGDDIRPVTQSRGRPADAALVDAAAGGGVDGQRGAGG